VTANFGHLFHCHHSKSTHLKWYQKFSFVCSLCCALNYSNRWSRRDVMVVFVMAAMFFCIVVKL
jgi:hypothetical protein